MISVTTRAWERQILAYIIHHAAHHHFLVGGCFVGLTLGLTDVDITWAKIMAIARTKKQEEQVVDLANNER